MLYEIARWHSDGEKSRKVFKECKFPKYMNKKILMPIALMVLVCGVILVSATMSLINSSSLQYKTSIPLNKGWNMVASFHPDTSIIIGESQIQKEDIKAMYWYSPLHNKYFQVYPKHELEDYLKANYGSERDRMLTLISKSAFWVYTEKEGNLVYSYSLKDGGDIDKINLETGWNFIAITPVLLNKKWSDIDGHYCNIQRAYWWSDKEKSSGSWIDVYQVDEIFKYSENIGSGIIVKVSQPCTIQVPMDGDFINPPQIPN